LKPESSPPPSIEFFVNAPGGKTIQTKAKTVSELKQNIHDSLAIPPEQQRLLIGTQSLEITHLLSDHVKAGDTVHLLLHLRGGGARTRSHLRRTTTNHTSARVSHNTSPFLQGQITALKDQRFDRQHRSEHLVSWSDGTSSWESTSGLIRGLGSSFKLLNSACPALGPAPLPLSHSESEAEDNDSIRGPDSEPDRSPQSLPALVDGSESESEDSESMSGSDSESGSSPQPHAQSTIQKHLLPAPQTNPAQTILLNACSSGSVGRPHTLGVSTTDQGRLLRS
jgi:hypothetical protein